MKEVTLLFPCLKSLIDFVILSDKEEYDLDPEDFTFTGKLIEADIELAVNGFQAVLKET